MKIAFYDTKPYDVPSFEEHGARRGFVFKFLETRLNENTAELAKDCDAVCVFVNDEVNAKVIDALYAYGVKLIALRCAGYNNVDVRHAFGKIHVVHVPSYSPHAVAEHAAALLLASVRKTHKAYIRTRDFNFSLSGLTGFDLYGKTAGIVGAGRIGRVFADICKGFGMNVLLFDRNVKDNDFTYVNLEELLTDSDIISLHCPLTAETHHLINADTIDKMKNGVVLLNTSRGALIDAEALINGIKSGKIGAAGLDVYEEEADVFFNDFSEKVVKDDVLTRLISMPNVIITSHQAFLTKEALDNIADTTVNNILSYFENDGLCDNELCYRCGNIERCKKERKERCF